MLRLHLYLGLALALYVTVIGVSGSMLVFRDFWIAQAHPELRAKAADSEQRVTAREPLDPDNALLAAQTAVAGTPISLTWPNPETPFWMIYMLIPRGAREVYVDPSTGAIATICDPGEGWLGTVSRFHTNLLLGRPGRRLSGYAAWALILLAISGGILWFSPGSRWGFRRLRPFHFSVGIVALPLVILLAFTGTYFIWPREFVKVVGAISPFTTEPRPQAPARTSKLLPASQLAELAQMRLPGLPLHRLQIVQRADQAVRATFRHGSPAKFHRVSTVFLDPVNGDVLGETRLETRPAGDSILAWFSAFHFGIFGGPAIRLLWFATGLSLPALAATGILMWWRRVLWPRRRPRAKGSGA